MNEKDNLLNELEVACKKHNFYYQMEDDHTAWTKGKYNAQHIQILKEKAKEMGIGNEAQAIYDKYKPEERVGL